MPTVLILITSDPRTNHRPAEAIRIAAGVGVWKKADISLYLREAAVLVLGEDPEGLVDEENYTRYLPLVRDFGRPVYVQHGAPLLPKLGEMPFKIEELNDDELARLAANSDYIIRF
jgi:sulfur relay (sulfurtransferase) DsrF/TusC family protein